MPISSRGMALCRGTFIHHAIVEMICAIKPSAARIRRRIAIFLRSAGLSGGGGGCHPGPFRLMSVSSIDDRERHTIFSRGRDSPQNSGRPVTWPEPT